MPDVYRSKTPLTMVEPEALVVYCSAARYQDHFANFLSEGLKLQNYSLIAIPGGIQVLTMASYLPKFSWSGWRWAKFLIDADNPPRLVLIGHEACRWYKHLLSPHGPKVPDETIIKDLRESRDSLKERFPKVRIDLFFARTAPDEHIVFDAL